MRRRDRVLVAMSGGVDSSVAAAILKEQGYDVIGATMKVWPTEDCGRPRHKKTCCSLRDIEDAKRVCDLLNIRHYILNFNDAFKEEVIDYFSREYLSGKTPNPCIICNQRIKFGRFLRKAEELGCDFIATGHHAIIEKDSVYRLKESIDKLKDQTYVLFCLRERHLKKTLFPVGGLRKSEIRMKAADLKLNVSEKRESQEICFVSGNNYVRFLESYCNIDAKKGEIVDSKGRILGHHNGYWNFTVGQRRGLGISNRAPLYVLDIDAHSNRIIVGDFLKVRKRRFIVKDIIWSIRKEENAEKDVKIRSTHKKARASLRLLDDNRAEVIFREPQEAITPGQAAVFYDGEYVSGGGWIDEVLE